MNKQQDTYRCTINDCVIYFSVSRDCIVNLSITTGMLYLLKYYQGIGQCVLVLLKMNIQGTV
jgi:hypothetical protein